MAGPLKDDLRARGGGWRVMRASVSGAIFVRVRDGIGLR
jgi:hypothetical protein